ncbi:META domain-containing protein [Bordetella trematum]|uniref:META domain-containing protein n=1 Tax=Bordetella trematum TaxID=123899 RepID=UPI0013FDBC10|nr:META domain-containing protein [Bordetella trematum]
MPFISPVRAAAGLMLALAVAGCATHEGQARAQGEAARNVTTSADSLAQTHWELTRWTDPQGQLRDIPHGDNGEPISLIFLAEGRAHTVAGFAGCNRYTSAYVLEKGMLKIAPPATTRMACPAPQRAALEHDYLQALTDVQAFSIDASGAPRHLVFTLKSGAVLDFTRRQDPPTPGMAQPR